MPLLLMRRLGDACILQSRREGRFEAFQACHALLETEVRVLQSPSSPGGGRVSSPKRDVGLWSWSLRLYSLAAGAAGLGNADAESVARLAPISKFQSAPSVRSGQLLARLAECVHARVNG